MFQKGMNHITTPTELLHVDVENKLFSKRGIVHHNNGGFALILLIGQCTPRLVPCNWWLHANNTHTMEGLIVIQFGSLVPFVPPLSAI